MVRASFTILKDAGNGLCKTLSEILVCPLSKQPLRYCEETNSLISDAIGVSFPIFAYFSNRPSSRMKGFAITTILFSKIKDGIPCLVPNDGKITETDDTSKTDDSVDSSSTKN